MTFLLELAIVVVLVLINGLFASAEVAVIAVRSTRVAELAADGRGAHLAQLRASPERFLATVQVGITVVGAAAAAFGGATWARAIATSLGAVGVPRDTADEVALVLVVVAVSYLSLVLGELVPKSLALRWAERYALLVARPLVLLGRAASPVVWVLTASSNLVLRLFGDRTSFLESQVSRDELLGVLDRASGSGEVSERAADIASRALGLDELHVGAVMIPRAAITAIDVDADRETLLDVVERTEEDRLLVRRAEEEIVGYVTVREIACVVGGRVDRSLEELARPVHVVPESALVLAVLEQLQAQQAAVAVVVDETGGIEGVVDIEDLAEELVGAMPVGSPPAPPSLQRQPDGSVIVPASLRVHVANRLLDLDLPISARWSTVGGLLLAELGALPREGDAVSLHDGTRLEAVEVGTRRAHRVRVHAPADQGPAPRAGSDG